MVTNVSLPEFKGLIIDVFEDFLAEKEAIFPKDNLSCRDVYICGNDYDEISDALDGILEACGMYEYEEVEDV